jgi:hypothetical protein
MAKNLVHAFENCLVFSKQHIGGFLYGVKLQTVKFQSAVTRTLAELETSLSSLDKHDSHFSDICVSGKVKMLTSHTCNENLQYRLLFANGNTVSGQYWSRDLRANVGVDVWKQSLDGQSEKMEDSMTYDVMKKRRAMEAPENADEENAPEALVVFEEFEQSVLSALENIRLDEEEYRKRELREMEESWAKGGAPPNTGGVYFAWSDCLKCMKIGATRREDPLIRLREISQYVTTPFILAAWFPTPFPFRQEAAAHRYFSEQRINSRGSGAGTEFFHIVTADAVGYCRSSLQG